MYNRGFSGDSRPAIVIVGRLVPSAGFGVKRFCN